MKKYKLYKKYNKSILTKNIANALKLNTLSNDKLFWSLFFSNVGISFVEMIKNVHNNKMIDLLKLLVSSSMLLEVAIKTYDTTKYIKSTKKLEVLKDSLKKKNIFLDIPEYLFFSFYNEKDGVTSIINYDNVMIESKNDEKIIYYDENRQIDITDEVKKALLSKRKYKKYLKNK